MYCLFVRQPWAWMIIRPDLRGADTRALAGMLGEIKNIENRNRPTNIRGETLIGASKTCTEDEWEAAYSFVRTIYPKLAYRIPRPKHLQFGGIIGSVVITNCVEYHTSNWFCGKYGYVLAGATPLPFMPCKGQRGFFEVDYTPTASTPKTL